MQIHLHKIAQNPNPGVSSSVNIIHCLSCFTAKEFILFFSTRAIVSVPEQQGNPKKLHISLAKLLRITEWSNSHADNYLPIWISRLEILNLSPDGRVKNKKRKNQSTIIP